jgi:hypothetical protein
LSAPKTAISNRLDKAPANSAATAIKPNDFMVDLNIAW